MLIFGTALSQTQLHSFISVVSHPTPTGSRGLERLQQYSNNPYLTLLSEFPAVTQACTPDQPVKHSISHHIETTGQPVFTRSRRLASERLRIARQEFDHMLELGIIRPTSSSWSLPLHMVPKHTPGDWRPCGDFHALNRATVPIDIPSFIFRTLQLPYKVPLFLHTSTLLMRTTNTGSTRGKPQDSCHNSIWTLSFSRCLSAYVMPPKLFSASWMKYFMASPSPFPIL